jgi:DNA mismatch repair protein MutL
MVPILPQALPSDSLSGLSTTSQRTLLDNGIRITGAISNHHYARYDRSNIFFLVNKRWIKSQKLSNAVMKGYGNALMQGRFPAAAILVEIDSTEVDINIHPRKEEVAFLHPRVVEMAITAAVKRTLEGAVSESLKKTTTMHPSWAAPLNSLPFGPKMQDLTMNVDTQLVADVSPYLPNVESTAVSNSFSIKFPTIPTEPFLSEEIKEIPTYTSQSTLSPGLAQEIPQVLGQYNTTYILLETHEGLMLMDQHAAHERILYEKFATHFEEVAVVNHLFPQIIQLTLEDVALIALHLDMIKKYGIVADIFGDDQIIVSATPVHCKNISFEELVRQIVGWIVEFQGIDQEQFAKAIREKVHAQMACKAAVKAGDVLSREQMVQLVTDLFNTNNRFSCPHGRPTTCLISLHEIEKKFRRKL